MDNQAIFKIRKVMIDLIKNIIDNTKNMIVSLSIKNTLYKVFIYGEEYEISTNNINQIHIWIKSNIILNTYRLEYTTDYKFIAGYQKGNIIIVPDNIKDDAYKYLIKNDYYIWLMLQYNKLVK